MNNLCKNRNTLSINYHQTVTNISPFFINKWGNLYKNSMPKLHNNINQRLLNVLPTISPIMVRRPGYYIPYKK